MLGRQIPVCPVCWLEFVPYSRRPDQKWCSPQCRYKAAYARNPKRFLAASNAYRRRHPERNRAYALEYGRLHKERIKVQRQEYNRTEKGAFMARLYANNRRARTVGRITKAEVSQIPFLSVCSYCGAYNACGLDHVVPIARGGSNTLDNVVPACLSCNTSKKARSLLTFLRVSNRVVRAA